MRLSAAGLELLKRSEGFRDRVYNDVAEIPTIGFGHRLLPGEDYPNGIDLVLGEKLLEADVQTAENGVNRFVRVPLSQGQFDALVDFVFNLGSGRLRNSTLLTLLNAGKYSAAALELLKWDHSGSKEIEGLKQRRLAEFRLWMAEAA